MKQRSFYEDLKTDIVGRVSNEAKQRWATTYQATTNQLFNRVNTGWVVSTRLSTDGYLTHVRPSRSSNTTNKLELE
jgi:hypothetical protein